jgi:hypothetical protein
MIWIWFAEHIRYAVFTQLVVFCIDWQMYLLVVCCQVVEEGYEFFAKRQLVTIFSAPNYCGEFENAGAMMSVDETLMCSFQVSFISLNA